MMLAGSGGLYEILLIILVVILIYNGLMRQKILKKVNNNLSDDKLKKDQPKDRTIDDNHEYVDFEEIKED